MDNQLKIKLTIKFETTYLFDYFKHEKLSTIFLLVLFISQMNGQKIDSLTIDKKLSYQSFIVPTALLTGGIFY
jgi:hypothetical protein